MTTKLTLSMNVNVVKQAKIYAKQSGRSLSEIVENYLKSLSSSSPDENLGPLTRKLKGAIALPDNLDYKKALFDVISEKRKE